MPLKNRSFPRSTLPPLKVKTLGAAIFSAFVMANVHAAGLGKLTVLSALGQPLRAEIELTSVDPDEAGSLVPKLASPDAYRQANVEYNPVLLSLHFAVEQRSYGPVIRVTSTQPINDPYVDMLLELDGNQGSFIREYTFLLDPPQLHTQQSAQFGPGARINAPAAAMPSSAGGRVATGARRAAPAPAAARENGPAEQQYKVKKGDTLAKIAAQYQTPGVSLDQMLVALYRANPDAFIGHNMNRMRAGEILSMPSVDATEAVSPAAARHTVIAQAADFNAYRSKLANQVATSAPKASDEGRQTASGKIVTKVEEQAAGTGSAPDRLKLSKAGGGNAGGPSTEDMIAKEKALEDANDRVKELEKNVNELQQLLEIKNRELAAQQARAAGGKAAVPPVAPATASSTAAASKPAAASATAASASAVAAVPVKPAAKPHPTVKPRHHFVAPPPPPPPGFFEQLTSSALFLPGAATLLALLAGLGIYSARRRKQPAKSFEDSIITDSTLKSNSLFGSTGGQSVDTNNSVFNSNFVPSASQLDTNEVDPIAEADVYIAYGRDAQAEEILKEALRNQPDRHAVRVKLLEIYASRKDLRSFEILATELYSLTKGEGEDWQQAANLGAVLDPGNPLYASGAAPSASAATLNTATRLVDEPNLDALLETTQSKAGSAPEAMDTSPYFGSTTLLADEALHVPPTSEKAAGAAQPSPESAPSLQPEVEDLEFDLEGLELSAPDDKRVAESKEPELPAEIAGLDLDFLDRKPAESEAAAQAEEAAASEQPAGDVPDLMFDLGEPPAAPAPTATAAAPEVLVPEAMGLDFPAAAPAAQPAAESDVPAPAVPEVAAETTSPSAPAPALDELPELEGLDEEQYSSNAEMATKLDLAVAYQEIGDKEGARELLEEVVKGGSIEQTEKARNLLAKLA